MGWIPALLIWIHFKTINLLSTETKGKLCVHKKMIWIQKITPKRVTVSPIKILPITDWNVIGLSLCLSSKWGTLNRTLVMTVSYDGYLVYKVGEFYLRHLWLSSLYLSPEKISHRRWIWPFTFLVNTTMFIFCRDKITTSCFVGSYVIEPYCWESSSMTSFSF